MQQAVVLSLLFALAAFAGCISEEAVPDETVDQTITQLLAGPALWDDPQNAPHAAFNWPTLNTPPAEGAPAWWQPIEGVDLPDVIGGIEHLVAAPDEVASGGGIAMFGSILYVPGFSSESYVLDVSDPTAPKYLATIENGNERGAAMIAYPDGRLVSVISTGAGFNVVDLTDPTMPELINQTEAPHGGHKLGVVPGTPYVYNAASCGGSCNPILIPGRGSVSPEMGNGQTEIYDLTDPENPVLVNEFQNGYSCHHIYFWSNADANKFRALCAGIEYTQIWDIMDPENPEIIVSVPVHHGVANAPSGMASIAAFSHYAGMNRDGTILMVGDEAGGGSVPPGCIAGADTPVTSPSVPFGAVWFYDITDETNPVLQGWYSPGKDLTGDPNSSCTAHHARVIPVEGKDMMAMAFYDQGVVLVDFTNPMTPKKVGHFAEDTNTWEVWYNNGYLFTGDLNRGTDVLKFV